MNTQGDAFSFESELLLRLSRFESKLSDSVDAMSSKIDFLLRDFNQSLAQPVDDLEALEAMYQQYLLGKLRAQRNTIIDRVFSEDENER